MGPGEVIAALALFVGAPWAVLSGIAKIKAAGGEGGGEAMRKSELEALVREAAEEAAAPLRRRVETLEAIVTQEDEAMDRIDPAVLADALGPDEAEGAPAAARRRTRA